MAKLLLGFFALSLCVIPKSVLADADDTPTTGYGAGLFGTLNPRSKYYTDWFSEPFRVEDTTIDNELRFDWEHDEGHGSKSDVLSTEIQKSVGILTFEIQAPYVITKGGGGDDDDAGDESAGQRMQGFGTIELGARVPLLQSLSGSGFIDNSIGFNLEVGIPTNTVVSKNAEITPGVFDDLAIGQRFSVQSLFSISHTFGTFQTGRDSFQYAAAFGYTIEDEDFSIPDVERLIPSVELVGNTVLDGSLAGHNALTGTAGCRVEFKTIGRIQPSFGVGYVFPIDRGGRDELHWGVITSLSLEF